MGRLQEHRTQRLKAKQRPTELYEVAEKLTPFAKSLVNITSYKDVIKEYVRLLLKVNYLWFDHPADDADASGHYLVIEVAALPESDRWALVTRGLTEDGRFVKGSWTAPIRNGDTTAYLSPDEAYRLLNDGLRVRREPGATAPAPAPPAGRAKTRAALPSRLDMDDVPVLFLQSAPDHPKGLLAGMYATGGLRDLLRNQDTLRDARAFTSPSVYHQPEAHEGGLLLMNPPRQGLSVESDGAVTAALAATADTFCHWLTVRGDTGSLLPTSRARRPAPSRPGTTPLSRSAALRRRRPAMSGTLVGMPWGTRTRCL
ncbi:MULTISPECIES: hypothetical protein [Streptomyces]|uniref:hypothetical protein n=1 Tax=Streptomyces sp. ID05-39B TaxID=3028664 RepID=UPI0029BFF9A6|nr:hypothetical protein [Streptomyces sp. ID05-39B]